MPQEIRVSRLIRIAFGLTLAAAIVAGVVNGLAALGRDPLRPDITDFHAFYIVGHLIWSGRFAEAYHASTMLGLEQALGGRTVFMPWSYPPLFGAVVAPLAALSFGVAFALFTTTTLALYLWAIARLDRQNALPVMMASTAAIALNLRCGQNGVLTAGIVAAASAWLLGQKPIRSGLAFAAMAIKPHLILLVPLALALQRRWLALAVAGLAALGLTGLSVAIFGRPVFAAFLASLPEVGRLIAAGAYPLHRMTSIFAFGIGIGLPPLVATLLHVSVMVMAVLATGILALRRPDPRLQLGLAIMAGFFISPYVYDYDQVLFGVGLLLVAPALRQAVSRSRYIAILAGWAVAQALGLALSPYVNNHPDVVLSPMGPAILAAFCCILRPLWREASTAGARSRPPAMPRPEASAA